MSTVISPVGIHVIMKDPERSCSQMKWYQISMCLEWDIIEREFTILSVLWLSYRRGNGQGNSTPRMVRRRYSQRASLSAWERTIYWASVDDRAVVHCLIADHATSNENMKKAYPNMLQQSVSSDAQSGLVNAQFDRRRTEAKGPMGCWERSILQCEIRGA